jgi:hypothetical protein
MPYRAALWGRCGTARIGWRVGQVNGLAQFRDGAELGPGVDLGERPLGDGQPEGGRDRLPTVARAPFE